MRFNFKIIFVATVVWSGFSFAESLEQASGQFYDYSEPHFTNPVCSAKKYKEPIKSFSGKTLEYRPKDVFCDYEDASKYNPSRSFELDFLEDTRKEFYRHPQREQILRSPQFQLLSWINGATSEDEIVMAYLSFSNKTIKAALCSAAQRGVKVTFYLDKKDRQVDSSGDLIKTLGDELSECGSKNEPIVLERGKTSTIGYHHFKLTIVKKKKLAQNQPIKIAFGSGNMSSGPYLHHENWNFVGTNTSTYFAKIHLCVLDLLSDKRVSQDKKKFREGLKACRKNLKGEESDIKTFFVPGEGERATSLITNQLAKASYVDIAAHRFSYRQLINALTKRVRNNRSDDFQLRLIFDDDMFWVGQKPLYMQGYNKEISEKYSAAVPNGENEYRVVQKLVSELAKYDSKTGVRYMQTNPDKHLLHHNKFIVFRDSSKKAFAVFAGAGNFTTTAFSYNARYKPNFENYYLITIPEIVEAYAKQYTRLWDLATEAEDLPKLAPYIGEILSER